MNDLVDLNLKMNEISLLNDNILNTTRLPMPKTQYLDILVGNFKMSSTNLKNY